MSVVLGDGWQLVLMCCTVCFVCGTAGACSDCDMLKCCCGRERGVEVLC